jgi:WD40 repeat protein
LAVLASIIVIGVAAQATWRAAPAPLEVVGTYEGPVDSLAFNADGTLLAVSAGHRRLVDVWDHAHRSRRNRIGAGESAVAGLAFSPDGNTFCLSRWEGAVELWDVATWSRRAQLRSQLIGIRSIACSPDGRFLALGSSSGKIELWSLEAAQIQAEFDCAPGGVAALAFAPDSALLASAGSDKTLRLWDVPFGHQVQIFSHNWHVTSVAFAPDGRFVASTSFAQAEVRLWDVATGQERSLLRTDGECAECVAFAPDNRTLAFSTGGGTVVVCDFLTGEIQARLRGHRGLVAAVAFAGKLLASGGNDGTVRVWDLSTEPRSAPRASTKVGLGRPAIPGRAPSLRGPVPAERRPVVGPFGVAFFAKSLAQIERIWGIER